MDKILEKINSLDFDKSTWKTYRFDQIAFNIGERVEPTNTDLEIYVGLEHLDSDSIHIRRFGKKDDVIGTKLRVYPGDIIFGRRRAYQRKAAIANFDGFCSAHAMVLRANPKVIDPALFPFFIHSDTFMHLAVDISVGSLSPTINWGTMKKQEFILPPMNQQAKIAELLWAADEMSESEFKMLDKLIIGYNSSVYSDFFENVDFDLVLKGKVKENKYFKYVELQNVAKLITDGTHKTPKYIENGVPFLSTVNLVPFEKEFDFSSYRKFISKEEHDFLTKRCKPEINDILISKCGTVGRCQVIRTNFEFSIFVGLALVKPIPEQILSDYLEVLLNTEIYQKRMELLAPGGTRSTLAIAPLKSLIIPLPPMNIQIKLVNKFNKILSLRNILENKIAKSKELQKNLINHIF